MSAGYIIYSLDWEKFRQLVEQPTEGQLTALGKLLRDGIKDPNWDFEDGDPILAWPTDLQSLTQNAAKRLALPDWYGDLSTAGKVLWEGVIFYACMHSRKIKVGFRVDNDGVYWDVIELAWKHLGVVPNTITDVALSAFGTRPYRYFPHPKPGKSHPGKSRAKYDREEDDQRASLEGLRNMLGNLLKDAMRGQKGPDELLPELQEHKGVSQKHKETIEDLLTGEESAVGESDSDSWSPMHSMHTPQEVQQMRDELRSVELAMKATKIKDVWRQYNEDLLPAIESIASDGRMLFIQVDT